MNTPKKMIYTGCSDAQAIFCGSEDPRPYLKIGQEYLVIDIVIRSYHTMYFIEGFKQGFNSACFKGLRSKK